MRKRLLVGALVLATCGLIFTACGGGAGSPTAPGGGKTEQLPYSDPAPAPTPTPSPSPTPGP